MSSSSEHDSRQKIWNLIKDAHSALLVTIGQDGRLDSRPMGCLQREFDDTLWFLTFRHSPKAQQLNTDDRVLVSSPVPEPAGLAAVCLGGVALLTRRRGNSGSGAGY